MNRLLNMEALRLPTSRIQPTHPFLSVHSFPIR